LATNEPVAIGPSRLVLSGLLGLCGAALLSVAIATIPLLVRIPAAIGLVAASSLAIRRYALLHSSDSVVSIQPMAAGNCILRTLSEGDMEATILPDSVAWPWMLLLRFTSGGKRLPVSVVVLPDSVAKEDWRRLSIWLRWQASEPAA